MPTRTLVADEETTTAPAVPETGSPAATEAEQALAKADAESVTEAPPALTLEEARAEVETWSRRRLELQAKIGDRMSQVTALDSVITQARRDAILGKAELGATAPLVAERATLQAEITELEELVTVALGEEKAAQLLFLQAHAADRVVQLRDHAAKLVERATASDERIDAALAEFVDALEERYGLFTEGQAFVASAERGDEGVAAQGLPGIGRLDRLRVLPLDWKRIPHANRSKFPHNYNINL
jgi:hypothetical protein